MKYIPNIKFDNYQIRPTATHIHFEIHKMLNFPKHFFPGTEIFVPIMTYEADYPLRGH